MEFKYFIYGFLYLWCAGMIIALIGLFLSKIPDYIQGLLILGFVSCVIVTLVYGLLFAPANNFEDNRDYPSTTDMYR